MADDHESECTRNQPTIQPSKQATAHSLHYNVVRTKNVTIVMAIVTIGAIEGNTAC